tara:strand:- start:3202 stop:3429 length:228 start_codon:yes stop_codon:yes gene_type:complete
MKKVYIVYEGEYIRGIYEAEYYAELRIEELKKELFERRSKFGFTLWGNEDISGLKIRVMEVGVPLESYPPAICLQ